MTTAGADGMLQEWGTRLFYGMPRKAKHGSGAVIVLMTAGSVRSQVRAAVRPNAKQVMVKITGGGRGMKAAAAHFRYISRLGRAEVGGKGHSLELEDENGDKLSGRDGVEGLQYDWRIAGGYIPDESHRREVFNIVLSMPGGTPADQVRDATRDFAKETFEGHKYVFALHDDTDSPHVHLAVRAERMDGVRLNPRKSDLQRWRERFAARLQDRGINAVATRASTRGIVQAPKQLWRIQAAEQSRERKPRAAVRTADSVRLARSRAIEAWGHVASALATSSEGQDRELAVEVVRYVGQHFGKAVPEQFGPRVDVERSQAEPSRKGAESSRQRGLPGVAPTDDRLNAPENPVSPERKKDRDQDR